MPKLTERQSNNLKLFKIITIVFFASFLLNSGVFFGFDNGVIYVCSIEKIFFFEIFSDKKIVNWNVVIGQGKEKEKFFNVF